MGIPNPSLLTSPRALWTTIVTNYHPVTIELVGTFAVQLVSFWLVSFLFLALDTLAPDFSRRHKLQPMVRQPSRSDVLACVAVVAKNQLVTTMLHVGQLAAISHGLVTGYRIDDTTVPTWEELVRDILVCILLREVLFYYSHRLLHHPRLYARIHKMHHRFVAPVALAAQYAHPIEQVFANTLPITLPPQLLGSHVLTFWAYLALELGGTATVHSGYDFFRGMARMHDLHHEKFNVNYGSIGLLDWIYGTNVLRTKAAKA